MTIRKSPIATNQHPMILEGIVTTVSAEGEVNIAPMGPTVEPDMRRFLLRPFPSAQTYRNLKATGAGVLHVTDDVWLLARAAVGSVDPQPTLVPAQRIYGYVLSDACRYYEFRITDVDESGQRMHMNAEVVHSGRLRDTFGFNRAKHAVLEAAILATRVAFLPGDEITHELEKLAVIVGKTGGDQEHQAMTFLRTHVERTIREST